MKLIVTIQMERSVITEKAITSEKDYIEGCLVTELGEYKALDYKLYDDNDRLLLQGEYK